ncbi:MAG TPA: molybdate ABC transporter substrate-binding protein [Thermoleophilaceae bacterium]
MALAAVAMLAVAPAGCGSGGSSSSGRPDLVVSAAASLKDAFDQYAQKFRQANVRASFAGSDELAAQIEQGVKPDVFASANTKLPEQLFQKGLVEKPVVFAGNRLVIAVPAKAGKVASLADLEKPGVTIAMGSPTVPVGAYTRQVLSGLPKAQQAKLLGNVRSNEPDVAGVVGKLTQGAVDAGFVYITDVDATDGKLKAIELPKSLQPQVAYGVAVVKGAKHPKQAQVFIEGLLHGAGRQALQAAGFEPAPGAGA